MVKWNRGSDEGRIEAFIGSRGVKTGIITDAGHLLELACRIFEVENCGVSSAMADRINALGKKERKRRADKNLKAVMGDLPAPSTTPTEGPPITQEWLERMMEASQPEMLDGAPFECEGELDIDPAKLLRKVVSAVISAGRADILYEFPEVLAFFGARIPQREEATHLHNVDQGMFKAAEKWPNRLQPDT